MNYTTDDDRPLIRRSDVVGISRGVIILLLVISPLVVALLIMWVAGVLSSSPTYQGYFIIDNIHEGLVNNGNNR